MSLPYLTPLFLVLLLYLTIGAGYGLRTPIWQAPDEPAHFNYVRYIAEGHGLPELRPGDYPAEYLQELINSKFPLDKSIDSIEYEYHHPPLFYLIGALPYKLSEALGMEGQVYVLRLFSLVIGIVPALATFFIARILFPTDDFVQTAAPFFLLIPQHLAMAASVNNDIAAEAVVSLLLLGLVQLVTEDHIFGLDFSKGVFRIWGLIGVLLGVSLITKTTAYIALPLIALALFLVWKPFGGDVRLWRGWVVSLIFVFVISLAVSGLWFLRNASLYGWPDFLGLERHSQVVIGQPRPDSMDIATIASFVTTVFRSFWLQLGWMTLPAEEWVYPPLLALTALLVIGLTMYGIRLFVRRHQFYIKEVHGLVLLGFAVFFALGALVFYNFQFIQPQGRYLFSAMPAVSVFFALGLSEVFGRRLRWMAFGLVVLGLLGLNLRAILFYLPLLAP